MKATSTPLAVCEEFTNTIIVDSKRNSIVLNIGNEWFDVLNERLNRLSYCLIHKTKIGETYTCVYIQGI